jgi:hypothetical protein
MGTKPEHLLDASLNEVNTAITALHTAKIGYPTLNMVCHHLALQRHSSKWPWVFALLTLLLATLLSTALYYGSSGSCCETSFSPGSTNGRRNWAPPLAPEAPPIES